MSTETRETALCIENFPKNILKDLGIEWLNEGSGIEVNAENLRKLLSEGKGGKHISLSISNEVGKKD